VVTNISKRKDSSLIPRFLNTFTFPLISGDPSTALSDPHGVVITEKFAQKLFGNNEAMGGIVRIDSNVNFTVTGILKDPPSYSMLAFDYLVPYSYRNEVHWEVLKWDDYSVETYLLLKPGISKESVNKLIKNSIKENAKELKNELFIYPFARMYLHGRFENGKESGGGIDFVNLIGMIGLFILLIACINYINLSTAGSMLRAREVGIRKVVGAKKLSLVAQFIGESMVVSAISAVIGLGIAQLSLDFFNQLVYTRFTIPYDQPYFWLSGILFIIITGLICGIYPSLVLTKFNPVVVLKGIVKTTGKSINPRKVLVVFQFSFSDCFYHLHDSGLPADSIRATDR
jgi:ABC-type antimicrobial peptide transport system permease subunit